MTQPIDRFRKVEHHTFTLLPCRLCGAPAELWQRSAYDDVWVSFGCCTNLEDVDGEACLFHLPDSEFFYRPRKKDAIEYWNLIMGPRETCIYAGCGKTAYMGTAICLEHHNELAEREITENR